MQTEILVSTKSPKELFWNIATGLLFIAGGLWIVGNNAVSRWQNEAAQLPAPPDWWEWAQAFITGNLAIVLTGLGMAGLGLYLAIKALRLWTNVFRLDREGHLIQGQIENRGITRTQHNRGKSTTYWVSYCFRAAGQDYTFQQTVSQAEHQKWAPKTLVTVRYLPDDPTIARVVK